MPGTSSESDLDLPVFGGRQSLRQNVAETLRALLITGRMKPGELYSAPKLAQQFGVSATPVREAMLDLVAEGHIEVVRNKGFRVTRLSAKELDDLAEIRRLIEPPIMAAVATDPSPEVKERIEQLRPVARAIVTAAAEEDFLTYIELDTQFHVDFLALHGNDRLVEQVRDLRERSRLFGLDALAQSGTLAVLAEEHERMVDLALGGKPGKLQALVQQHIDRTRADLAGDAGTS